MGGSIDMERKGCQSIGYWTHYVTLSFDLELGFSRSNFEKWLTRNGSDVSRIRCWTHYATLNLASTMTSHRIFDFSRSNFKIVVHVFQNGWPDWYETKGIWSDRTMVTMSDLTCDLDLGFMINFENNYIWGITWDITSVHGKFFCQSVILGSCKHSQVMYVGGGVLFLSWWPPSTLWAYTCTLIFVSAPTRDVWTIILSFWVWGICGYMLHVEHISCVITNCG